MTKEKFEQLIEEIVMPKYPQLQYEDLWVSESTRTIHISFKENPDWDPQTSDFDWFNEIGLHLSYLHIFADYDAIL